MELTNLLVIFYNVEIPFKLTKKIIINWYSKIQILTNKKIKRRYHI